MKDIMACDIGNGYGKASILEQMDQDPVSLLPASLKSGMPTTAYADPAGNITVYSTTGKNVRRANRAIHAVKTRLDETAIELREKEKGKDGKEIVYTVSPAKAYAAIARDLVIIANEQRAQKGQTPLYELVLTYPACFAHREDLLSLLKSSVESVELDGHLLKVRAMLPEPAAVGLDNLYYMKHLASTPLEADTYTVLVYDLGHGTFDIAVVTTGTDPEKPFDLICQDGLPALGGSVFDDRLVEEIIRQIGYTPTTIQMRELIRALAVEIKHELTTATVVERDIPLPDRDATVTVTRERFEELIMPAMLETMERVQLQLEEARNRNVKIDAIVLSGGASQMPIVQRLLEELTEHTIPVNLYRPNMAVTYGAARYAQGIPEENEAPPKTGSNKEQQSNPNRNRILTQHAECSFGIWHSVPGSLDGAVDIMLEEQDQLPMTSRRLSLRSSPTGYTRIQLSRTLPKQAQQEGVPATDTFFFYFNLPGNTPFDVTVRMNEERCTEVSCHLPDGTVLSQNTFDHHSR